MTTTTTGWIWMQGAAIATTPIASVNNLDNRPAVADLITEYRILIDQVAKVLSEDPLYDASKHDDLWILRFLLSHKRKVKAAIQAAKHTLSFRDKYQLDIKDTRYDVLGPTFPNESFQRYMKYCKTDMIRFIVPDPKLGVIGFVLLAGKDQHQLAQNLDPSDWLSLFLYISEWSFQWLDYITRTTGRLTSSVRIIDLTDISFSMINMETLKQDGKSMKVTEDCYPQMLKAVYICNSPTFVQSIWRLVRPLFPRRVVEKMGFFSPTTNTKERDRLLKYIALEHLPTRYGGTNPMWPMDTTTPLPKGASPEDMGIRTNL